MSPELRAAIESAAYSLYRSDCIKAGTPDRWDEISEWSRATYVCDATSAVAAFLYELPASPPRVSIPDLLAELEREP